MGQKVSSKKSKALTNSDFEFISLQTGLQQSDIKDFYSGFSQKTSISKKDFILGLSKLYPKSINPNLIAEKVFQTCDENKDGTICFNEFAIFMYMMTKASKEEKLKHIFDVLDSNGSGTLSSNEVVQAIKIGHDIIGDLNFDYNQKGVEVFRKMDTNNDMKVTSDEFIDACLKDEKLMELLEGFIAAL
eukprot:01781.XXX_10833_11651_1 [CDS] Oithona nana genome sequencing.